MAAPRRKANHLRTLLLMALLGAAVGGCLGALRDVLMKSVPPFSELAIRRYPYPHHVPKYRGGVSLRFAMVHDVIHERYPRHGKAYYRERNRLVRRELEQEGRRAGARKPSRRTFELLDDLGAGLDALGRSGEAVRVMRDKLRRQQSLGLKGLALYRTYANLGTFLIHANARQAIAGDRAAKEQLREGLAWIHRAIRVNPQAHFGRESWQAVAVAFLLAAIDSPGLLLDYDMVGNPLNNRLRPSKVRSCLRSIHEVGHEEWKKAVARWNITSSWSGPDSEEEASQLREHVARLGVNPGWVLAVRPSLSEPVPFDEPALGIIGMWRLGGGANPHFALAMGNLMVQVGQYYIAWTAYERAVLLADRFWPPDRQVRKKFVAFCRTQQAAIEEWLPDDECAQLASRFRAELAHGLDYQKAYQDFEERQIRAGVPLHDPHFYDAFHSRHGNIASPVGKADRFLVNHRGLFRWIPLMVLLGGVFAFLAALLIWVCAWAGIDQVKDRSVLE
jgi:hypothetical protein